MHDQITGIKAAEVQWASSWKSKRTKLRRISSQKTLTHRG